LRRVSVGYGDGYKFVIEGDFSKATYDDIEDAKHAAEAAIDAQDAEMRRCGNEVNGEICMLAQEFHWIADQLVDAEKLLQADDAEAYLQD
jgi:hypothetical protein